MKKEQKKIVTNGLMLLITGIILITTGVMNAGEVVFWPVPLEDPNNSHTDYSAVATGYDHFLVIRENGTVVGWGNNDHEQCNAPDVGDRKYVKVDGGMDNSLGLLDDGSLVGWGDICCDIPEGNDFIDISVDDYGCNALALKEDGEIICMGDEIFKFPDPNTPHGHIAVSAGSPYSLALNSDGTLDSCDENGPVAVPEGNDFVKISASTNRYLALRSNGEAIFWNKDSDFITIPGEYIDISAGSNPLLINTDTYLVSINGSTGIIDNSGLPTNSGFVDVAFSHYDHKHGGIALSTNEQVSLTMESDPINMNTDPSTGVHNFYKGKIIRITAFPSLECPYIYRFNNWSGDIESEVSSEYITMNENKSILATYSLDDSVCGDECHPIQQGDMNGDCYVNFDDFLLFSAEWLSCTHPDCD